MNLRRPARALDRDLRGPDARREVAEEALPEQRPPRRRSAAARELELPVRPVPRDLPLHMRHGPAILTPQFQNQNMIIIPQYTTFASNITPSLNGLRSHFGCLPTDPPMARKGWNSGNRHPVARIGEVDDRPDLFARMRSARKKNDNYPQRFFMILHDSVFY